MLAVITNGYKKMSELHEIVKRQFDKQAQNFSNWSVTKNIEYQKAYFDFCEISSQDTLLDFACGTGEYDIFAAPKVKNAYGVDISKGMIEIAQKQAADKKLKNISFLCHPVEKTPFEVGSFSIVNLIKSAGFSNMLTNSSNCSPAA